MSDPVDEISKIVKSASRDAYAQRWKDALAAVAKATNGLMLGPDRKWLKSRLTPQAA